MTADDVIRILNLQKHPVEGGYFIETYRSVDVLPKTVLPNNPGPRSLSTAIYYLLTPQAISAMHRLPTDEVFHFYLGDPVQMLQLGPDGSSRILHLGTNLLAGEVPQTVVPGGVWQGSCLVPGGRFALLGATMAPGFDYADYEGGDRADLISRFPQHAELLTRLTCLT